MKKLKESRALSFALVAVVYIIVAALSVICTVPSAFYLCAGALANTILFFAVSIPMADGRQSRKEGFADYKKQTRMLLPIKK